MDEWYYASNGAQQGPVSAAVLMQLLSGGQVPTDSLVWRQGMGDWVAANTVPELLQPATTGQSPNAQPVLGYGVVDSMYQPIDPLMRYAGFWIRFAGAFIDGIVVGVGGGIINAAVNPMIVAASRGGPNMAWSVMGVNWSVSTCVGWIYVALMQSSSHQATLGQMATGLRVTDLEGRRINFARATGRYFAAVLSGCILYIGYLMMLWSPRKQTLHDQIAGTLVLTK